MKNALIYIHGKGGNAKEAEYYKKFFSREYDVIGLDYQSVFPWAAEVEFAKFFTSIAPRYSKISLIANSIGAYYAMLSLADNPVAKAMFISPIVDMEKVILKIMARLNLLEEKLYQEKEIATPFGETLSWEYLSYVRNHPIHWHIPTSILYAENDDMTSSETITAFAKKTGASLTIMQNGEHWFHTGEQMMFLDKWFTAFI